MGLVVDGRGYKWRAEDENFEKVTNINVLKNMEKNSGYY